MKLFQASFLFLTLLAYVGTSSADPVAEQKKEKPSYVVEAPLPEAWPTPGPYNLVTKKKMPAYRAAFTTGFSSNLNFMRLFRHIKKQEIPMTSPVLMPLKKKEGSTRTDGMAFLYQNQKVSTDSANEKVVVQDMPAREVLSYTWQGDDGRKEKELAKEALTAYATEKKLVLGDFQLLGYNGPGVAKEKRTWELQATMAE